MGRKLPRCAGTPCDTRVALAQDEEGCARNTQHGLEIIELLIAHGADINATNNAGRTPLDQMLHNGRQDLAAVLRRQGGNSA